MGEIGVKMKKGVTFMIRGCFRSIYNHPFLVGILCFLIYLNRSSPFIFSLLLSVSPVLICTALLLGTLLSFGQLNLPEIEIEETTSHETVSLKAQVSEHQNDSHSVERQSSEERSKFDEVHSEYSSDNAAPLIKGRSLGNGNGNGNGNGEDWKDTKELAGTKYKEKAEWYDGNGRLSDDEIVENHYSSIPQETSGKSVESDDERSESNSFDSERVNVDSLDSPPRSPWKRVAEREDEEEEEVEEEEDAGEDTGMDSGSDRAESSSPDASMADIMPMLDELHPLLDEDGPQPINMSENESDTESDHSSKSSASIHEETCNEEDSEIEEDENDDGEDEGVVSGGQEAGKKSAITWTEEDEKNLMDLGSSELERNQRLENLILRRRARKNISMVPDLNLIDLESTEFPFNIPPISTARQNPFINSHDSYGISGLPPIPGSAPSVLLPRRNPFDIPYDSSEEKPNLVGDGLHEELKVFQSREPFFKRHESFNAGPSFFGQERNAGLGPSIFARERQDVKLRPFFVPERMVGEESSYSALQRQSSELSESKASSVPETESLGSVEDFEDRRLSDEDNGPELESLPSMKESINEDSSLEEPVQSSITEEVVEEDELQEHEPISGLEHVSEHVGHGSQSSEDEEEASERICSRDSSSSSLSEVSERVYTDTETRITDANLEHPVISTQTSLESTDLRIESNVADEVTLREPVYDSSPPAFRNNLSSSSISSDVHAESELALPPVLVKRTVSFVNIETGMEIPESSSIQKVDENESRVIGVIDESVCEVPVEEIQGGVPSSSSDDDIHDVKSSEKYSLADSTEAKHSASSGKDDMVRVSGDPSTSHLRVAHLVEKDEIVESAQSPLSDSDVYLEAYEKLSVTPSAEGIAVSYFNDNPMHQRTISHVNEMEAHNIVAESSNEVRPAHESNMPELQELDHESLSTANSPLSPDFISIPSTTSGAASPHTDLQTIAEEADEIKEIIDEGILSELDSVGDFSVNQWGSASDELDKHVSSVEESSSVVYHAVISPAEGNTVGSSINSENSNNEMEMYEQDMQRNTAIQIPETCVAEHIDISDKEYSERGHECPHYSSSEDDDTPPMNMNENLEDQDYGLTEVELDMTKAESRSWENGNSKLPNQSEDADLEFGENSITEVDKSVVLEPHQSEMIIKETVNEPENSAISEPTHVERVIKETTTEHETSADLEPGEAKLVTEGSVTEHSQGETSVVENSNHEAPVLEIGTVGCSDVENTELSDSTDHVLPVAEPREIHVASTDLHVAGPSSSEGTNLASEEMLGDNKKSIEVEEQRVVSSVDLHVAGSSFSEGTSAASEEMLDNNKEKSIEVEEHRIGSSMDLHVLEPASLEGTDDPTKQVLDDNMEKSIEVEEHEVVSSNSNVKKIGVVAEKSDHIVEANEKSDLGKTHKGKDKASKSSSSSSSSSSDSSSSDSDED